MKIKIFTLTTTGISLVVFAVLFFHQEKQVPQKSNHPIDGMQEGAKDRVAWELKRLRSPYTGKIPSGIRTREIAFAEKINKNYSRHAQVPNYDFTARGPWNVGGRTRALAIDVNNENIMLAGSVSGGIWRTTDGGARWSLVSTPSQSIGITCITQDKRLGKTNIWYAGTGEAYGASATADGAYFNGNGIYKSVDSGKTWAFLPYTSSNTPTSWDKAYDFAWNIATDPSDTLDEVYVAAITGIHRSTNGGNSWLAVKGLFSSPYSYFTDVAITPTGVLYAALSSDGTSKGIWRSTNGLSWTSIMPPGFPAEYKRIVIAISPADEKQVYFLANTPNYGKPTYSFEGNEAEWNSLWKYNYLSGNGNGAGGVWQDLSQNLPNFGSNFDKFNCQGSYDLVIAVHPTDTNIVFIGGTNLYRSDNQFKDSTSTVKIGGYEINANYPQVKSYPNHHSDQHAILFLPSNPSVMISGNDGGIFRTSDCLASSVSWELLNNGYLTTQFYTVTLDHGTAGSKIILGGLQDNGTHFLNSQYLEDAWAHSWGGDGSYCAVADGAGFYYLSIQKGKTYKVQLDNLGNRVAWTRIDPIGGSGYQFINPFVMDPNDNDMLYMIAGTALWRNDDLSVIPLNNTWDSISTNWTVFPDSLTSHIYTTVSVSKSNPANRVYLGSDSSKVYRIDNANTGTPARTDITGSNFPQNPGGSTYYNPSVSCIAVDPRDGNKLLVVFSNYETYSLYYSEDAGASWKKVAGNLEQFPDGTGDGPSCRWAAILPEDNGKTTYFVGTSTGLYATDTLIDNATVWTQQATGTIGNAVVDMIDVREPDKAILVGTHGYGMFTANMSTQPGVSGIAAKQKNVPLALKNYPNPFGSNTQIEITLPYRSHVALKIYDIQGKEIAVLKNEEMSGGRHTIPFRAVNLPNGVYYCSLKTEKFSISKAMVHLN